MPTPPARADSAQEVCRKGGRGWFLLLSDAGYPSGFNAGYYTCDTSYANLGEAALDHLAQIGIRASCVRWNAPPSSSYCHCASKAQALELRQALEQRFADCQLQLHPQKTKVVYCKDANRPEAYPERSFDFLGYTFRSRVASGRDRRRFVSFSPRSAIGLRRG